DTHSGAAAASRAVVAGAFPTKVRRSVIDDENAQRNSLSPGAVDDDLSGLWSASRAATGQQPGAASGRPPRCEPESDVGGGCEHRDAGKSGDPRSGGRSTGRGRAAERGTRGDPALAVPEHLRFGRKQRQYCVVSLLHPAADDYGT